VLRQEALLWNGVMSRHMHGLASDDHVLTVLPFFHVGGLNIQTTPALHTGATVTILSRFTPDATLAAIARDRPTLTVLVPAIIQAVTDHPDWASTDLSSLKAVSTGSTIVPPHLIERLVARGVPVLQVYGSTETCPVAVYTRLGGDLSRVGSTGLPGLCCEAIVIDDTGHIDNEGGTKGIDNRFFYSRAISDFWQAKAGVQFAVFDQGVTRSGFMAGVEGVAPYGIHLDAVLAVSQTAVVSARLEAPRAVPLAPSAAP